MGIQCHACVKKTFFFSSLICVHIVLVFLDHRPHCLYSPSVCFNTTIWFCPVSRNSLLPFILSIAWQMNFSVYLNRLPCRWGYRVQCYIRLTIGTQSWVEHSWSIGSFSCAIDYTSAEITGISSRALLFSYV
jgi:hypothetical protein